MKNPKVINYPDIKVIMRKDFYDNFGNQLKKITRRKLKLTIKHLKVFSNFSMSGRGI